MVKNTTFLPYKSPFVIKQMSHPQITSAGYNPSSQTHRDTFRPTESLKGAPRAAQFPDPHFPPFFPCSSSSISISQPPAKAIRYDVCCSWSRNRSRRRTSRGWTRIAIWQTSRPNSRTSQYIWHPMIRKPHLLLYTHPLSDCCRLVIHSPCTAVLRLLNNAWFTRRGRFAICGRVRYYAFSFAPARASRRIWMRKVRL